MKATHYTLVTHAFGRALCFAVVSEIVSVTGHGKNAESPYRIRLFAT